MLDKASIYWKSAPPPHTCAKYCVPVVANIRPVMPFSVPFCDTRNTSNTFERCYDCRISKKDLRWTENLGLGCVKCRAD